MAYGRSWLKNDLIIFSRRQGIVKMTYSFFLQLHDFVTLRPIPVETFGSTWPVCTAGRRVEVRIINGFLHFENN